MGIYPSQSTVSSRRSSINLRNISFLISFLLLFASTTGSFWFLAQTNIERVNNFYIALTELACINNFLETWRNVPNKIQLVGKMEKFVKKSEFIARWQPKLLVSLTRFLFLLIEPENADLKIKYTELDEKLTKISHIIQFVMVKLTIPSVMLPSIIPTFINYFYLELGKESYALTYPLMYDTASGLLLYFSSVLISSNLQAPIQLENTAGLCGRIVFIHWGNGYHCLQRCPNHHTWHCILSIHHFLLQGNYRWCACL